jgi:thiosulfate/3-mercaptopyruvate sulfurtransferase
MPCVFPAECNGASSYDLALIEPAILNRNLSDWIVLDARPKTKWQASHIHGAMSFSWEDYTSTDKKNIPYSVWSPEKIAAVLGKMGIDENSPVVVYGDADTSWGGEGWVCWVLMWLGHQGPIRLLAGGVQAWENHGFPVGAPVRQRAAVPVEYRFKVRPEVNITTNEIEQEKSNIVLVDTRSTLEWIKGHLPGAVHLKWNLFYSGKDRRPISSNEMRDLLHRHEIAEQKPVVYYCTGGIRSAYVWLVHTLSGLPSARNYEGGMEAWNHLSSDSS